MDWFKRNKKSIEATTPPEERRVRTEGLWAKCESCGTIVFRKDLEANLYVCPKCQFHFKMSAKQRLEMLLDSRWTEHDAGMTSTDPLKFVDTKPYAARLKEARKKLGMNDAVITAEGRLNGRGIVCCAMEFGFIGGVVRGDFGELCHGNSARGPRLREHHFDRMRKKNACDLVDGFVAQSAKNQPDLASSKILVQERGKFSCRGRIVRAVEVHIGIRLHFFESARPVGFRDSLRNRLIRDAIATALQIPRGSCGVQAVLQLELARQLRSKLY